MYDCSTHELHEVSQSRRKHARAFAQSVFADAVTGLESVEQAEQGVLTKKDVRTYFKAHPIEKAHILSERFKWPVFFEGAQGAAEGSKVRLYALHTPFIHPLFTLYSPFIHLC